MVRSPLMAKASPICAVMGGCSISASCSERAR
jgi:hypothetical protein